MKKLMIAAAIVCAAACVQASSVVWKTATGLVAAGSTTDMQSGTLQLLAVAKGTAAADVFASVKGGTFDAVKTATLGSDGKIAATTFTFPKADGDYDFYSIFVDGDTFFISDAKTASVSTVGDATVSFMLKNMSNSGIINDAEKGYAGAGWYSSVPEPTSGLLLLLGVAGLALRRRRA